MVLTAMALAPLPVHQAHLIRDALCRERAFRRIVEGSSLHSVCRHGACLGVGPQLWFAQPRTRTPPTTASDLSNEWRSRNVGSRSRWARPTFTSPCSPQSTCPPRPLQTHSRSSVGMKVARRRVARSPGPCSPVLLHVRPGTPRWHSRNTAADRPSGRCSRAYRNLTIGNTLPTYTDRAKKPARPKPNGTTSVAGSCPS
ncbi:hypothetical protein AOLI_G00165310 [Acnodon oligacanthus]